MVLGTQPARRGGDWWDARTLDPFMTAGAKTAEEAVWILYEHHWLGVGQAFGEELSGRQAALQFFTGYLIEKSLSLDNIFVIALIMRYFAVPVRYQHRLLFWGVLGALVMRGVMISLGVAIPSSSQVAAIVLVMVSAYSAISGGFWSLV